MKRPILLLAVAASLAACAGRAPAPSAPAPAAPAGDPTDLRYVRSAGRYRLESRTHVEQEMMGQTNATDITTAALFSADIAEAEGNLGVAITVDSLSISAPVGALDPAELTSARGKIVRAVFSPLGRPISLTPPDSAGTILRQVAQGLREFLPALPPGGSATGATWTDTSSTVSPSQGVDLTVHMAREHRATWEDRDGARALHIATTATYTVSGSGEVQGQSLQFSGGGQSVTNAFVASSGVYLGSTVRDSALVNATVVSAGIVVPVRRLTNSTFTRLP